MVPLGIKRAPVPLLHVGLSLARSRYKNAHKVDNLLLYTKPLRFSGKIYWFPPEMADTTSLTSVFPIVDWAPGSGGA